MRLRDCREGIPESDDEKKRITQGGIRYSLVRCPDQMILEGLDARRVVDGKTSRGSCQSSLPVPFTLGATKNKAVIGLTCHPPELCGVHNIIA